MNFKKQLLLFLIKFIVVFAILQFPVFRNMYANAFRSEGNRWFSSFGEKGITAFIPKESARSSEVMAEIKMVNKDKLAEVRRKGLKDIDVFGTVTCNWYGYLLIAYLVALIAATPISWKRKLFSLATGLVLAYAFFILNIWVLLLYKFHQNSQLQVLHLTGLKKSLVEFFYPILVENPGTIVFVALVIWILVIFRKGDFDRLLAAVKSNAL